MSTGTVGDAFPDLAPAPTFAFRGREYAVRPASPATVVLFENEVARQMRANLEELRGTMSPADYAGEQAAMREQLYVAKAHQFGGAAHAAKLNDPTGTSLLFWSYVAASDASFTPQAAFEFVQEQPERFVELFAAVTPDFFRLSGKRRGINPAAVEATVKAFESQLAAMPRPTPAP